MYKPHPQFGSSNFEKKWRQQTLKLVNKQGQTTTVLRHWHGCYSATSWEVFMNINWTLENSIYFKKIKSNVILYM